MKLNSHDHDVIKAVVKANKLCCNLDKISIDDFDIVIGNKFPTTSQSNTRNIYAMIKGSDGEAFVYKTSYKNKDEIEQAKTLFIDKIIEVWNE